MILIPILLFFICLFLFPADCVIGAKEGLLLWFNTMIPSVFPFILMTSLFKHYGGIEFFARLFGEFIQKIFRCKKYSAYPVIVGGLCGYPMGAKAICDCLDEESIDSKEASYLLSFVNNPSPIFVINYVCAACLDLPEAKWKMLFVVYLSAVINSKLWYWIEYRNYKNNVQFKQRALSEIKIVHTHGEKFNLINSLELIQKIGVYMTMFSIICQLLLKIPIPFKNADLFRIVIIGLTEQTTGLYMLKSVSKQIKIVLAAVFTCFGGFATIAQTYGIIRSQGLSIKCYLIKKITQSCFAGILCFIFLSFN